MVARGFAVENREFQPLARGVAAPAFSVDDEARRWGSWRRRTGFPSNVSGRSGTSSRGRPLGCLRTRTDVTPTHASLAASSHSEAFGPLQESALAAQAFVQRSDPGGSKLNESRPPAVLAHECSESGLDVRVGP